MLYCIFFPDGELTEIQKLIVAAESLAVERTKLKMSYFVPIRDKMTHSLASVGGKTPNAAACLPQGQCRYITPQMGDGKGPLYDMQVSSENSSVGAANSGYFSISDEMHSLRVTPKEHNKSNDSRPAQPEKVCNNLDKPEQVSTTSSPSALSSSYSSVTAPENGTNLNTNEHAKGGGGDTITNIPRLALGHISALSNVGDVQDERVVVSKVEKEVCNSTIRESSSSDSSDALTAARRLTVPRPSHNSVQNLQHTTRYVVYTYRIG